MRTNIIKLLAAALAVALIVPVALAIVPNARASSRFVLTGSTWTHTSGPTLESVPFPSGGTHACVSWTGKIAPALGRGVTAGICSVKVVCPRGGTEEIPPADFAGGAQGASFTIYVKQDALKGKCSKELRICFCESWGEERVTVRLPAAFNVPTIDYGGLVQLPPSEVELAVKVLDRFGAVNESYYGEVVVSAHSEGGGVKLNGTWGQGVVTIEDGAGTIFVDASTVPSGGLVTFDLVADRTDSYRTSIERQ